MTNQSITRIDQRIDEILSTLPEVLRGELRGLQFARQALVESYESGEAVDLKPGNPAYGEHDDSDKPSLRSVVTQVISEQRGLTPTQIREEAGKRLGQEVNRNSISSILSQKTATKHYVNDGGRYWIPNAA